MLFVEKKKKKKVGNTQQKFCTIFFLMLRVATLPVEWLDIYIEIEIEIWI